MKPRIEFKSWTQPLILQILLTVGSFLFENLTTSHLMADIKHF